MAKKLKSLKFQGNVIEANIKLIEDSINTLGNNLESKANLVEGKIPQEELPSYVDAIFEFDSVEDFPEEGQKGKIYLDLAENLVYRWSGSLYIQVGPDYPAPLILGEEEDNAFSGLEGANLRETLNDIVAGIQTLKNLKLENSLPDKVPLTINAQIETVANLQDWKKNNESLIFIDYLGRLRSNTLGNFNNVVNSKIELNTTGTKITRNVNDSATVLIVDKEQGNGNVFELLKAGVKKIEFNVDGDVFKNTKRFLTQYHAESNLFLGTLSGKPETTGIENTAVGSNSLKEITSGSNNVVIGFDSGNKITSASNNVLIGKNSGGNLVGSSENVGLGSESGSSITSGSGKNTFIGNNSGNNALQLNNATNSTAIGNSSYTNKSNQFVLGNADITELVLNRNTDAETLIGKLKVNGTSVFDGLQTVNNNIDLAGGNRTIFNKDNNSLTLGTNNTSRLHITNNGLVGVGTTSPSSDSLIHVEGSLSGKLRTRIKGTTTTSIPEFVGFNNSNLQAALGIMGSASTDYGIILKNQGYLYTDSENLNIVVDNATGKIRFGTGTSGGIERVVINSEGLVSINEATPSAQLQIKSGATTRVPLIVDTLASHTEVLQQWRVNGSQVSRIDVDGALRTIAIRQFGGANNALIDMPTTGTTISRNVADSNAALKVNQIHASSSGDIVQFQNGGTAVSLIDNKGVFAGSTRPKSLTQISDFTLALSDEGKVVIVNSSSNVIVIIPLNSVVAFPIDTEIAIVKYGSGEVSINPTSGVTLNSLENNRKVRGQYGAVALKKINTNEWLLIGSLEA